MLHKDATAGDIHVIHQWEPADATARAALVVVADDVGKIAWQQDNDSFWVLVADSPMAWARFALASDIPATPNAAAISIADAGTYFASTDVEGALQELGSALSTIPSGIDDLSDVDTATAPPSDGDALVWNAAGSEWVPGSVSAVAALNDLTDVDTTGVSDGDVLTYDSATGDWIAAAPTGGGGGGSGVDLVAGTVQNTTSGTQFDFSIPAGCRRFSLDLSGVSLSGTDHLLVQLMVGGSAVTSGYASDSGYAGASFYGSVSSTAGMVIQSGNAAGVFRGTIDFDCLDAATYKWVSSHKGGLNTGSAFGIMGGGAVTLAGAVTGVRLTRTGSNTFDAGAANTLAVSPASTATGLTQHEISLYTANGYGSTNTNIRKYSTVETNVGTSLTLTQSASLGDSITVNTTGLYSVQAVDNFSTVSSFGITRNVSANTSIDSVAVGSLLSVASGNTNYRTVCTWTGWLTSGDVLRVHGAGTGAGAVNNSRFRAVRLA